MADQTAAIDTGPRSEASSTVPQIAVLAGLAATGTLATNILLPSLPQMAVSLNVTSAAVTAAITVFLARGDDFLQRAVRARRGAGGVLACGARAIRDASEGRPGRLARLIAGLSGDRNFKAAPVAATEIERATVKS
ncbi:hypothetical protein V1292_004647 [Bradyrhizobium sp. AZCC 1719]